MRDIGDTLFLRDTVHFIGDFRCINKIGSMSPKDAHKRSKDKDKYNATIPNRFVECFIYIHNDNNNAWVILKNDKQQQFSMCIENTKSDISAYNSLLKLLPYFNRDINGFRIDDVDDYFVVTKAPNSSNLTITTNSIVQDYKKQLKETTVKNPSIKYGSMELYKGYYNCNSSCIVVPFKKDDEGNVYSILLGRQYTSARESSISYRNITGGIGLKEFMLSYKRLIGTDGYFYHNADYMSVLVHDTNQTFTYTSILDDTELGEKLAKPYIA